MPQTARYYLGRVIKLGNLNSDLTVAAIRDPVQIRQGEYGYTFTTIVATDRFVYARLAKFTPQGAIEVVEPERHRATIADISNLLVASSPFVYIPEYSGIVYQHVWNKLQRDQFERIFPALVTEKYQRFFAESSVEPISDLRTFVQRIASLTTIVRLEATVHPPNPLFGPAWESLRNYMRVRNVNEVHIREEAASQDGISTNIARIAGQMLNNPRRSPEEMRELLGPDVSSAGDAAVLMAADGYGKAKVVGRRQERRVVVRTQESQISFMFDKDPEPEALYAEARQILAALNDERYLDH